MTVTQRKGFTLIEMLIVVAVIGILASLVLVGLAPVQRQGRDARRVSDLRQVQTGLELYFVKNGTYPSASDWSTLSAALTSAGIGITNMPKDPTPSRSYRYGSSDGSSYVLAADLEDTGNSRLDEDLDGNIQGIDCGTDGSDTIYCVSL